MSNEPQFERRDAQPYVGIRRATTIATFPQTIDSGWPVVFGWLAEHHVEWAGAPFIRYLAVDMDAEIEIHMGVPVAAGVTGDDAVFDDALPAGRYLVAHHFGPYGGLLDANAALQQWAIEHDVAFAAEKTDTTETWVARTEHYPTNPAEEPDTSKWEVVIAYLTRD